jgi:hypothetical protein
MKRRSDSNRSANDENHVARRRQLDERPETKIAIGEGQVIGDVELVAGQREFRKDEQPDALLCSSPDEPDVAVEVGRDIPSRRDRLGGR